MRTLTSLTLGLTIFISGYVIFAEQAAAAGGKSHAHMGHITLGWKDTPDGKGLLPTAIAEANIAAQHAGFAAKKPNDFAWMHMHAHHVLHAIDASLEAKGPGLGYGVIKAASGTDAHVNFAAKSNDASDNVRAHAVHVSASAKNTLVRAKQIIALAQRVVAAGSAAAASPLIKQIATLTNELILGSDANSDGKITWKKGEGGLNAVSKHMGLMAKGEGMN